jgi:cytochrome c-type biogenesis protein CcmH/NrfG
MKTAFKSTVLKNENGSAMMMVLIIAAMIAVMVSLMSSKNYQAAQATKAANQQTSYNQLKSFTQHTAGQLDAVSQTESMQFNTLPNQ